MPSLWSHQTLEVGCGSPSIWHTGVICFFPVVESVNKPFLGQVFDLKTGHCNTWENLGKHGKLPCETYATFNGTRRIEQIELEEL